MAVGEEPVRKFNELKTPLGKIKLLYPIDSVKDRLAAFYHWNDKQGLEQALSICQEHEINLKELEEWSISEKQLEKFQIFKKHFKEIINR